MLNAYFKSRTLAALEQSLTKNPAQVAASLDGILAEDPSNARALFLLARKYLLDNEPAKAEQQLELLLQQHPKHLAAQTELAKLRFAAGRTKDAIEMLGNVTSASPDAVENWLLLSEWHKQDKQTAASENALRQYQLIKAFNDKLQLAEKAYASTDFKATDAICRQLLKLVPNEVRTLRLLAKVARQFQYFEFSTATLARCVETRPADVALGLEYAWSLLGSRMYSQALAQCRRLVEVAPEHIETYGVMAEVLYKLGQYDEAIEIYRSLADVPEKRALSLVHLGKVLKTVGQIDAATDCYRQAITAENALGQAYWELANLKTARFSADEVQAMQGLVESTDLRALDRVLVQFSLGKALEDSEDYSASFGHYDAANRAYANMRPANYARLNERFEAVFTSEYFAARDGQGEQSNAPVFVVGMPRSGSTLVEQILSSHSLVDATSELDEIVSIARSLTEPNTSADSQYPQSMATLGADRVHDLAQRYLEHAQLYRGQAPYFIDKAPQNFHHIGLIKTLFPNAKIIDVRRNPLGCGWSLYRQFFGDSFLFSYDLETIGHFYSDYLELMQHWHTVLPGQILTVHYEDLVTDLQGTVGALLDYCGLTFEDACLDFHLNDRAVATPSSEQVRQPLYAAALDHWKHYDEFLAPLRKTLARRGWAKLD